MDLVKQQIETHSDFPQKGILFRDIMPVFRHPEAYSALLDELQSRVSSLAPNCAGLIGIESRGFLLASPLALRMKLPFVPARKSGKLPGSVCKKSFDKEYGQDVIEIQRASLEKGKAYVILDDLLATGGTLKAVCDLVKDCGASVAAGIVVIELTGLPGRQLVEAGGNKVETLLAMPSC